ncbi:sulfite exporter TauE/SafE family protein [Jannaschia sp. W003]|uniref:sulfite exporter TauE/SafE family protein n=1 Tax=Jannaschia sp. W003 TaxID=2867012 RepID=UPI0021A60EAA|nr:sulfite exporter TauE/SafE family protein [Jannaschia sp. W003]UWQ21271.1 sulfite exporter TauE/SafE family protein [Jannaschia sp. W003]
MDALSPLDWTLALGIALFAGVVKGMVGFALPLVLISGLSSFLDPKLALAGILVPVLVTNGWQTFRTGLAPATEAARLHWRYLLMVIVAIFATAQLAANLGRETFFLVLGIPVVALALVQLAGLRLHVPPGRRRAAEWGVGLVSGVLGGLAGTWGPTTVLFLLAIDTPKVRQMVVQGVIYGAGSVVLVLAHLRSGVLNAETAPFSAALLAPALLGMWAGFRLQDRMDASLFRRATLVLLVVAGANLVRKGLAGL